MEIKLEEKKDKNKNKATKILIIFIILLVILIIGVVICLFIVKDMMLKVYIDGKPVTLKSDDIIIEEGTNKVYVSIKDIATSLGYEPHNGEYKIFSEDTNKCWVYTKNETASFFLNSNKISKVYPDQTKDYEDYRISDPVIEKNGKLYTTSEGIEIGFNSKFKYDEKTNTININTLPNLVETYTNTMKGYGYSGISADFNNQKAILYNLFIVKKSNGLYGVVDAKNKEIISSRYQSMVFNENTQEFSVRSTTNKVGIVTTTGETKINLAYDSIMVLDKDAQLYVVGSNSKYGVIDAQQKTVIYIEYDQIGISSGEFTADNISNKYLIFDNLIPVYKDKKWGAFDKTGNIIIPIEHDSIGYNSKRADNKEVNPLLIIPKYKGIVFGKKSEEDKKIYYGIYENTGKLIVPIALQNAYSETNAGINTYYMTYKGNQINIEEYIEELYRLQNAEKENTTSNNQNQLENSKDTNNIGQMQNQNS